MLKYTYILFALLFSFQTAQASDGHEIVITIDNYEQDTLIVGYYYGKQTLVQDTLLKDPESKFVLSGEESLDPGVYILLLKPDNQIVQFMVDAKEQQFTIDFDAKDQSNITYKGSNENQLFGDYLAFLSERRNKREPLVEEKNKEGLSETEIQDIEAKIEILDNEVSDRQKTIMAAYPHTITSLMIKANRPLDVPEFEGTDEEVHNNKYQYFRKHYFDNIEMANPISIRTPFFNDRIDYYKQKLTYQVPDSVIQTLDFILEAMEPTEEIYKYYLSQFINDYAKSKVVGQDAVYVYLAENYYGKNKAPWVDEENAKKIVSDALKLKPTLIGSTAPDFQGYNLEGELIGLDDIDADYRVLFFWKPDCGHCTKAVPIVKEFYKNYKDKGVEIIAICTKLGKDYQLCWDGIKDLDMGEFVNLGDQYQRSKVLKKYNAVQTPRFFFIDRDDKIIMKGIGAEQLDEVMDEMLLRAESKK